MKRSSGKKLSSCVQSSSSFNNCNTIYPVTTISNDYLSPIVNNSNNNNSLNFKGYY
jgi:hypothetical protein